MAYKYRARACGARDCHCGRAFRAAWTAAAIYEADPCATSAIFSPVAGLVVSKSALSTGCRHSPSIKWPKCRSCRSSQSSASFGSSGSGPYSMVRNFSAMLIRFVFAFVLAHPLCNRMAVICGVPPGGVVFQLPFNVIQKSACPETKELGLHPRCSQFFFHQRQPFRGLLSRANPTSRLETNGHPRFLSIFANSSRHHKSNGKCGIGGFFAG